MSNRGADGSVVLGKSMRETLQFLTAKWRDEANCSMHCVAAQELHNITKAAQAGDPGTYGDSLIQPPRHDSSRDRP